MSRALLPGKWKCLDIEGWNDDGNDEEDARQASRKRFFEVCNTTEDYDKRFALRFKLYLGKNNWDKILKHNL